MPMIDIDGPGRTALADALHNDVEIAGDLTLGSLIFRQRFERFTCRLDEPVVARM